MTTEGNEKIRWLRRYASAGREIDRLCEEVRRWASRAERVTPDYSFMPHGGGENPMARAIEEMAMLQDELLSRIKQGEAIKKEIEGAIAAVCDERMCNLLRYRYLDGYTFERIAEAMDISYQWAHALHGRALVLIAAPPPTP